MARATGLARMRGAGGGGGAGGWEREVDVKLEGLLRWRCSRAVSVGGLVIEVGFGGRGRERR